MNKMKWTEQQMIYGTDGGKNEFFVRLAKCDRCQKYAYNYSPYGEAMNYRYCPHCGRKNRDITGE